MPGGAKNKKTEQRSSANADETVPAIPHTEPMGIIYIGAHSVRLDIFQINPESPDILLVIKSITSLSLFNFPDPIPKNIPGIKKNNIIKKIIQLINGDCMIDPVCGFLKIEL